VFFHSSKPGSGVMREAARAIRQVAAEFCANGRRGTSSVENENV